MALLMGILHSDKYTERVIRRLSQESLENKKVMLEIFSYPLTEEIRAMNHSFTAFWEGIAKYVLSKEGTIIYGEDESLYYQVLQRMDALNQERRKLWAEHYTKSEVWRQEYPLHRRYKVAAEEAMRALNLEATRIKEMDSQLNYEIDSIVSLERNPHFAKVCLEEKPGVVILGHGHMPYLIEHGFPDDDYSLVYIPSEILVSLLRTGKV